MKKLLVNILFGNSWDIPMDRYIANCNTLAPYGWDWLFITDNQVESKGNFKVVPMQLSEFVNRIQGKFGIRPNYHFDNFGKINFHLAGYQPALGYMFPELVAGYDFWGITNLDVVFGRLDKFITDEFLQDCDVYGDDPNAISGVFSLFRNYDFINRLFKEVPDWQKILSDKGWYGFDEREFSEAVRQAHIEGRIRFKSAHYAGSEAQGEVPVMLPDGTLLNKVKGNEIMLYHFSKSKRYPDL